MRRAAKSCQEFPINVLESIIVFLLSLWKTYVGPALGACFDMSDIEALGYTMLGAGVTVYTALSFERDGTRRGSSKRKWR